MATVVRVWLRKLLYRLDVFHAQNLPVPVIVVGNVFVGGVGKTPLVIALVKQLTAQGLKVGVLSRGYGRSGDGSQSVTAQSSATEVGDEPVLIARACQVPVFVGKNRFQTGQHLLAQTAELIEYSRSDDMPFQGVCRLGCIPTIAPYLMPDVVLQIQQQWPDFNMILTEN